MNVRRQRYRLRQVVSSLLGQQERAGRCGCNTVGATVSVMKRGDIAHISGVETCGSIWACPVCAARISEQRRLEVRAAISQHYSQGGAVYMVAFTSRHFITDDCKALRLRVSGAFSKLIAGKLWGRIKARFGLSGYIRALEVTHGKNGWHPHLHVLFFVDQLLTDGAIADLEQVLFDRWSGIIWRESETLCNRDIFHLELCATPDAAGEYVAKWGADSEMTKLHMKDAKGGCSPWQLLKLAERGGVRSRGLFRQFFAGFKGARQLTWSKGLKVRFGIDDLSDDDLSDDDDADSSCVAVLSKDNYRTIQKQGLIPQILECAETGGARAVYSFLAKMGFLDSTLKALEKRVVMFPKLPETEELFQEALQCQRTLLSAKGNAPIAK